MRDELPPDRVELDRYDAEGDTAARSMRPSSDACGGRSAAKLDKVERTSPSADGGRA